MTIVRQDIASLLDGWIEAERNGVKFPVPFEAAYSMAGYARKDNAKRSLPKSAHGILYLISSIGTSGRPRDRYQPIARSERSHASYFWQGIKCKPTTWSMIQQETFIF